MKTFLSAWWERVRTSYWFVPGLMALGAMALSIGVVHADEVVNERWLRHASWASWIWMGGAAGARQVLATIAGSTITVAGVVFSITIVALSLASSQFGPRLLRSFMGDRLTQTVLGTFIATFLYCLMVLRTIRGTEDSGFVPHISVTLGLMLAVASVFLLIVFIHHVCASILADNLVARVAEEMRDGIDRVFPDRIGEEEMPTATSLPEGFEQDALAVASEKSGFVQAVDGDALVEFATERNLVLRILRRPGEFVAEESPLAEVWPAREVDDEVAAAVRAAFYLGRHRTPTQDVEYCFDQLAEVAARALSPGINDPFTAMTCVEWLGVGLIRVASRATPSRHRCGEVGRLRVVAYQSDFAGLADAAFNAIRQYGCGSASVVLRMLEVIARIAPHTRREEDRKTLARHAEAIRADGIARMLNDADKAEIEGRFRAAAAALARAGEALERRAAGRANCEIHRG